MKIWVIMAHLHNKYAMPQPHLQNSGQVHGYAKFYEVLSIGV